MAKQILHKGYYVFNVHTLDIVSDNIQDPDAAEAKWKEVMHDTPGPDKFAIIWVPNDNFAWGE